METTEAKTDIPSPKLRRYQYRLRTLLIVMLLASIGMSWFAVKMQRATRQREAVEAIESLGGWVVYDCGRDNSEPRGPAWMRTLLGRDLLGKAEIVCLSDLPVDDEALERLKGLHHLLFLELNNTGITDIGVEHIEALTTMQGLWLGNTQVTDAGLMQLQGLTQLQIVYVKGTRVTNEGVKKLQEALPDCEIIR